MKRFVKLILVLAIVCVLYPTGVAAGSKTAEKKLSKAEAKAVAEQIKAQWLADTKVRLASVYNNKVAKSDTLTMPLWWRVYGQKPADGYSLYISLHGGGGVPAADNDQQWETPLSSCRLCLRGATGTVEHLEYVVSAWHRYALRDYYTNVRGLSRCKSQQSIYYGLFGWR